MPQKSRTSARKVLLATCVFSWEGEERRSARYGAIRLDEESYGGHKTRRRKVYDAAIRKMVGQRVRLTAEVVENRVSGHLGDEFLKITPKPQPKGTVVDLGIGLLRDLGEEAYGVRVLALEPEVMRATYWINPHRLYELHDQTVRLYATPTTDAAPEPFREINPAQDELIVNRDGATYQVRTLRKEAFMPLPQVDIIARPADGTVEVRAWPLKLKPGQRMKLPPANAVKQIAGALKGAFEQASGG